MDGCPVPSPVGRYCSQKVIIEERKIYWDSNFAISLIVHSGPLMSTEPRCVMSLAARLNRIQFKLKFVFT